MLKSESKENADVIRNRRSFTCITRFHSPCRSFDIDLHLLIGLLQMGVSTNECGFINTVGSPNIARPATLRIWHVNQISNNIGLPMLFSHMLHQQECTRLI